MFILPTKYVATHARNVALHVRQQGREIGYSTV